MRGELIGARVLVGGSRAKRGRGFVLMGKGIEEGGKPTARGKAAGDSTGLEPLESLDDDRRGEGCGGAGTGKGGRTGNHSR